MSSNEKSIDWNEDDLASDIGAAAGYHHGLILGPDVHPKLKAHGIKQGAQLIKIGDKHVHYWEYHVIRGYLDDYLCSAKQSRLVFRNKVTWNNSSWKDTFLSIAQTLGCCGGSAMKSNDRFIKHRNHNAAIKNLEVKMTQMEQKMCDLRKENDELTKKVIELERSDDGPLEPPMWEMHHFVIEALNNEEDEEDENDEDEDEDEEDEGERSQIQNENARDDNV